MVPKQSKVECSQKLSFMSYVVPSMTNLSVSTPMTSVMYCRHSNQVDHLVSLHETPDFPVVLTVASVNALSSPKPLPEMNHRSNLVRATRDLARPLDPYVCLSFGIV